MNVIFFDIYRPYNPFAIDYEEKGGQYKEENRCPDLRDWQQHAFQLARK